MFHTDCYQILLLNFRSSTETVSQEDSQIDFATGTFFALWGGGGYTRTFLNLDNNRFFKYTNGGGDNSQVGGRIGLGSGRNG